MHGNLDVTLMVFFVEDLLQNSDKTSTIFRQNPVDDNPKLSDGPQGVFYSVLVLINRVLSKFCRSVVKVLSKFCRRPPTKTTIKVTSRLPCIGHLTI